MLEGGACQAPPELETDVLIYLTFQTTRPKASHRLRSSPYLHCPLNRPAYNYRSLNTRTHTKRYILLSKLCQWPSTISLAFHQTIHHPTPMSYFEKAPIGAQVVRAETLKPSNNHLALPNASMDNVSSRSLTQSEIATPLEEYDPTSSHPFSAFYSHPTTRTSFEQAKSESRVNIKVYEQDLEAQSINPSTKEIAINVKECKVWPSAKSQYCNKNLGSVKQGRNPLKNLSKKQALLLKILIALFIIGVAIGLGIGISKAVGSGIWKNNNSQRPIGDTTN